MNYKETAQKVLENVGGPDNVKNVYHCATRLRFTLNASGPVRMDALKNTPGVISVLGSGTQIQVVIGATVNKVFNELQPLLPAMESNAAKEDAPAEKGNLLNKVFNVIAGIFAPYLPLLMCSGILTGLLTLAGTMGWMDTASGTYAIFSAASNSLFYFFPILLSFTAAKQFGTNPYVAVVIGATLIHPTFAALADLEGAAAFLGIPVVMQSYASSVIPAIAGVGLYAVIDRTLSKVIPDSLRSLVVTLAGMVIVIPVTILVFGPLGNSLSTLLGDALNALVGFNPLIAGILAGGLCGYMAMFGLQWGIIPIIIMNIANQGFDYFTPMWLMGCYGQMGVALGVFLRAKTAELKQLSLSSFLSGIFTGVTEPILYGILSKYIRLNLFVVIGGAIGGAVCGLMRVKAIAFLFAGVLNFPGYVGDTFVFYVISMALAVGISAGLTYVFGAKELERKG